MMRQNKKKGAEQNSVKAGRKMTYPKIGVGILIMREGKLLLGRRIGSHGADSWSTPGGHLEFGETPEQCARRKAQEETGLHIEKVTQLAFTDNFFTAENKHYVTLFMLAENVSGTPERCEPEKCAGWAWFSASELPQPLFAPLETLLKEGRLLPVINGA